MGRCCRSISIFVLIVVVSIISCAQSIKSPSTTSTSTIGTFGNSKQKRTRRKSYYKSASSPSTYQDSHHHTDVFCKEISPVSIHHDTININNARDTRGGGDNVDDKPPSIYWAILHNWLYFMSLGFNLINIQFLVREIVDGDAKATPSAKSIALSGRVESVDKLLTFLGIGFLSALSDKFGRKPLMWVLFW